MLHTRWSAEAWSQVKAEFKKAFALRSSLRRAGWLRREGVLLAVSLLSSARLLSVRVRWRVGESDAGSAVAVDYVQRAETTDPHRPTFNQGVVGSSPTRLTSLSQGFRDPTWCPATKTATKHSPQDVHAASDGLLRQPLPVGIHRQRDRGVTELLLRFSAL
jgi:hypothetical protein